MAGLLLFSRAPVDAHYVRDVLPVMVLLGAGAGLCFPALMGLAMSGATPADAGLASGLVNTTAQVGGALGLALLATVAGTRTGHLLDAGTTRAVALTAGYHLAFWIAAALVLGAVVVAVTVLESPDRGGRRGRRPRAARGGVRDDRLAFRFIPTAGEGHGQGPSGGVQRRRARRRDHAARPRSARRRELERIHWPASCGTSGRRSRRMS